MEAEPPKAVTPKRKRRWYQFSLRTLFVFTLIVAIPCALLGRKIERKQRERAALKTIREYGGSVTYDYQLDQDGGFINGEPPAPKLLRNLLGDDFFGEAVAFFSESRGGDAEMVKLGKAFQELPYLKEVRMCAPELTDAGLANLAGLTQIESLNFYMSEKLTDAGLQHVKRLPALRSLGAPGNFSDAAISDLQKSLPECKINE